MTGSRSAKSFQKGQMDYIHIFYSKFGLNPVHSCRLSQRRDLLCARRMSGVTQIDRKDPISLSYIYQLQPRHMNQARSREITLILPGGLQNESHKSSGIALIAGYLFPDSPSRRRTAALHSGLTRRNPFHCVNGLNYFPLNVASRIPPALYDRECLPRHGSPNDRTENSH